PSRELPRIDAFAHRTGGYLEESCHILMHTVGRTYAADRRLTLAQLQGVLPRSNHPSCSAGFAPGLITYLGPQVLQAGPRGALAMCDRSRTRYERYSCVHGLGHAYMRTYMEALPIALHACRALGPTAAQDCAQGAFHDYWFSLTGTDSTREQARPTTSPR